MKKWRNRKQILKKFNRIDDYETGSMKDVSENIDGVEDALNKMDQKIQRNKKKKK